MTAEDDEAWELEQKLMKPGHPSKKCPTCLGRAVTRCEDCEGFGTYAAYQREYMRKTMEPLPKRGAYNNVKLNGYIEQLAKRQDEVDSLKLRVGRAMNPAPPGTMYQGLKDRPGELLKRSGK